MGKTDFNSYDREFLQNLINESTSISEVLKKLDLAPSGTSHVNFSKFIKENNYDTTTLVGRALNKGTIKGQFKLKELSKCLVKNGSGNSNQLRQRLINAGVKKK